MDKLKKTIWLSILVVFALSLGFGYATAQQTEAPQSATAKQEDWKFHTIIDVQELQPYVTIPKPEGVMIVDSRPYLPKYAKGHIPTAVSIPDSQFDKMTDKLPQDKNTLLVFYCGGFTWKLSHKSAWKAEKLGYTNVKVFAAGYPAWLQSPGNYAEISVEYVAEQIEANTMVLVDSRPKKAKYDKGHIPTAISLPDSNFDELQGKLPADKNNLLVFYCGGFTWKLSHKSARKAVQYGYTNVRVFAAGYPAWKEFAGADASATAIEIKKGKEEGSIDIEIFTKIIEENPDSIMLIDVRDPDEFAAGSFKTAINIPVDDLEKEVAKLPTDKPIVFVCSTGARSGESFYMLQDVRPDLKNVHYLDANVTFNKDGTYKIKKTQ